MIYQFIIGHSSLCSIFAFGLLSLFLQMLMAASLNSYVKASGNMKMTKKKVLLNLKNQFETIYGMEYQVRNTSAYVEKYLMKLKFLGMSYRTWEKTPFLSAGIVTLIAGIEMFYAYIQGAAGESIIEIIFAYGITMVCFYVFYHIFSVKNKKEQIQIQLVDYLENYLANRLLRTKNTEKVLNHSMEEAFMDEAVENDEIKKEILKEEKDTAKEIARNENHKKKNENENTSSGDSFEEDMDMLRRLVKEMEEKHGQTEPEGQKDWLYDEEGESQIAASQDDIKDPNLELLEEFVQSFLA